eukprot:TRINITY_DN106186_c0_g1_i1.p1 TRINITY_DN106186_c0_g1~~TRINITY_DN106186_c0_g1_i1.p1  ORF type:complete len:417 (+),score=10.90 TRINITY_DN106186_c0_g1_i1:59-1252(+)
MTDLTCYTITININSKRILSSGYLMSLQRYCIFIFKTRSNLYITANQRMELSFESIDLELVVAKSKAKSKKAANKLIKTTVICGTFMIVEFIGGILANSIAIMSDAAHLLSDFSGFLISLTAIWLSQRPASGVMTFGYHRAEIIGALSSVVLIWALTFWLVSEAICRVIEPVEIEGGIMTITAAIGLGFNIIMGTCLHSHHGHNHSSGCSHDHEHKHEEPHEIPMENLSHKNKHSHTHNPQQIETNVNVQAAMIHIIGDIIQSVGVLIAAILIYFFPSWTICDPICTFIFSVIVLFTTIPIVKDCMVVLMEGSPHDIDTDKIMGDISRIEGVEDPHDLHVWSLSMGKPALSVHLRSKHPNYVLAKVMKLIKNKYQIYHSTIQIENEEFAGKCANNLH